MASNVLLLTCIGTKDNLVHYYFIHQRYVGRDAYVTTVCHTSGYGNTDDAPTCLQCVSNHAAMTVRTRAT